MHTKLLNKGDYTLSPFDLKSRMTTIRVRIHLAMMNTFINGIPILPTFSQELYSLADYF